MATGYNNYTPSAPIASKCLEAGRLSLTEASHNGVHGGKGLPMLRNRMDSRNYFANFITMKAIVIGGTGATGRELVRQLVDDSRFREVVALVRRPFFDGIPKLREIVVDFENLEVEREHIQGDVAFSCLGTTLKDAGSKGAQWRVDHDYQLKFAALARDQGIPAFVLLSAAGARTGSLFFYSKMKGVLENSVRALGFTQLTVIRPGAIDRPATTRIGEKRMVEFLKWVNQIGLLRSYAAISTVRLAQAMIKAFFAFPKQFKIVDLSMIRQLTSEAGQ